MKLAISSDMYTPIIPKLLEAVKHRGHEVHFFGPQEEGKEEGWTTVTRQAIDYLKEGKAEEAIVLCWTGTGCTILANKYPGIRAALCVDGETAKGARIYNHANVLGLSLRLLNEENLPDILEKWFSTPFSNDAWTLS